MHEIDVDVNYVEINRCGFVLLELTLSHISNSKNKQYLLTSYYKKKIDSCVINYIIKVTQRGN